MRRGRRLAWVSLGAAVTATAAVVLLNGRALIEEWHIRGLERSLVDYASVDPEENADFRKLVAMKSQRCLWHFLRRYQDWNKIAEESDFDTLSYYPQDILQQLLTAMSTDALPFLEGALKDPDPVARAGAASALRLYGDHAAHVEPLLKIGLHDREALVRCSALVACEVLGPAARSALPQAIRLLRDPDADVRAAAVGAGCAMADDPGILAECVREALADPSSTVRAALAEALGSSNFSDEERIALRLHLLQDRSSVVRSNVAFCFHYSDRETNHLIYEQAKLLPWTARLRVEPFIRSLRSWPRAPHDQELRAAVLADLRHPDASIRAWAASLLLQAGPFADIERDQVEFALSHSEPAAREWAVDCLGERGDDGVALLTRALGDASPAVRRKAATYLARRGKLVPEAAGALAAQLEDRDRPARIAAAAALLVSRPDDPGALRVLREGLAATDLSTRCFTLRHLRSAGRAARALRQDLEGMLEGQPEEAEMLAREALAALR